MKCCDITIGMLNRQVQFERATKTRIDGGGYGYSWSNLLKAWVSLKPKVGTEKTHAGQLRATNLLRVIMRYTDILKTDDLLHYRGEDYEIKSIINIDEADVWLELTLEKGVIKRATA